MVFKIIFVISLYGTHLLALDKYNELFTYLAIKDIVVGYDISQEEFNKLANSNIIDTKSGYIDYARVDQEILNLSSLSKQKMNEIRQKIKINPNHPVNKEISHYLDDHNERIEQTQKGLQNGDEKGFFTKIVHYILDLMKF